MLAHLKTVALASAWTVHFYQGGMGGGNGLLHAGDQDWALHQPLVCKQIIAPLPLFFGPPCIAPCVSMAWCMPNNCCKNTPQFRAPQCQWVVACLGTQVGYIANYTNNYVGEWRSQHYTTPIIIENKRVSANFRVRFHLKITRSQRF